MFTGHVLLAILLFIDVIAAFKRSPNAPIRVTPTERVYVTDTGTVLLLLVALHVTILSRKTQDVVGATQWETWYSGLAQE